MGIDLEKLKEKYSKNKPTFSLSELMLCISLIIIGCALFFAMPDDMGILGWILFVVGTFLNVVGIFRLAAMVPEVKSDLGSKIATVASLFASVFIQFIGLLYLYKSGGTGKGAAIGTLALCISLGLVIYAVDFEDERHQKKIKIACAIITIFLVVIAVFLNIRDDFSTASVSVGTILLIEALITGRIGFLSQK